MGQYPEFRVNIFHELNINSHRKLHAQFNGKDYNQDYLQIPMINPKIGKKIR